MDNIVERRIGFGKAQWLPFIFLFIVDMNDGAQLVLSSFLTPVVQHQWQLTSTQASTMTSMFYLGSFIGSIASGYLSDRKGRRFLLRIGSTMQLISTFLFLFAYDYHSLNIIRFLYGVSFGFTIVLTTSMFAETSTLEYRGKGLLLINFAVSFGKIYGVFLAYVCLQSFHQGNWKLMMILSSLPNIIVLYGTFFIMKQSPRFLAAMKRFEECYQVLQFMIQTNHPMKNQQQNKLSPDDKAAIVQWQIQNFQKQNNSQPNPIQQDGQFRNPNQNALIGTNGSKPNQTIFDQKNLRTTFMLSLCWISINFMYFGQLVVLPFIYGKQQKSFASYALTVAGQAPSLLISIFLIDRQGFGRKMSLFYFFALSAVFHGIFIALPLTIVASFTRLLMKQCFQMLYPFTTQSFSTLTRTFGFGFCAAMGRLGSTIMPFIILPLIQIDKKLIFLCFVVAGSIGSAATYFVPRQSMNKPLDYKEVELRQLSSLQ